MRIPLFALVLALALPAAAEAKAKTTYYVALGDSLAAGYQQDAAGAPVFSANSYVNRLYRAAKKHNPKLELVNYGCPGESTTTFVKGSCPFPVSDAQKTAQQTRALKFFKAHKGRIAFVTVSLGANEFTPCAKGGSVDISCVLTGLDRLKVQLPPIAKRLRKALGKKVPIATHTLYNPYLALWFKGGEYRDLALASPTLALGVNNAIRDAVAPAKFLVGDVAGLFRATDVTTTVPFAGAQVPVAVANTCRFTQNCLPAPQGNIHPDDAGYALMYKALKKVLPTV